jgi:hypothetical protein
MHRWLIPLFAVVLVGAAFVGSLPAASRVGQFDASPAASPVAGEPMRFVRELLGFVPVEGSAPDEQYVVLTRVTLAPGSTSGADTPMQPHAHGGPSLLYVESGTVCYHVRNRADDGVAVQVTTGPTTLPDAFAVEVGCERPQPSCTSGCEVLSPASILLKAGETVAHSVAVEHAYEAVGRSDAVVYISELQTLGPTHPCAGGCH